MKNNIHNYIAKVAIDCANITSEEVTDICMRQEGTLFEVDFTTEWVSYTCYVDLSGEVLGFLSIPIHEHDTCGVEEHIRQYFGCCA